MSWGPGNIPFSLTLFQENSVYTYLKNKPKPKNNLACCLKTHISFLCVWSESECHSVLSNSLQPRGLYSPWNSPGQSTGVGCLSLLRGIFPTQGLNPGLLHCRQILYQLSHMGSQGILKWVAYPFSSGSSQPRNRTRVSCIAGGFFASWATGKAKNIEVGSLSLLQQIFPTQESNQGLLHCRLILH